MRRTTSSASFSCDYDQTLLIVPSVSKIWGIPFSKKSFSGGWVFYKQWSFALVNINPKHFIELWKDLSLRLIVRRFQRSCKVQFPLSRPRPDVLIRGLIPPPPPPEHFHSGCESFMKILSSFTFRGDMYFDVLIIGLF